MFSPETEPNSLCALLYLASPARPTGAFSWSGGLAALIDEGLVDGENIGSFLKDLAYLALCKTELPLLARAFAAALGKDRDGLFYINSLSMALKETSEKRLEEKELGGAVIRLLKAQDLYPAWLGEDLPQLGYICAQGIFAAAMGLKLHNSRDLLLAHLFSYLENLVTVGTKTLPLGQNAAQKVLLELISELDRVVDEAQELTTYEDIGFSTPLLSVLSSWHEDSPMRMYRS
jgi:urease accessory protein